MTGTSSDSEEAVIRHASAVEEQVWIREALVGIVFQPALRVWIYRCPAVVLGCSQRADVGMVNRAAANGVDLCVRPSGGGAVLAGSWLLGTSVILPSAHPLALPGIAESFRWYGEAHARWLHGVGIGARCVLSAEVESRRHLPWACFGSLSHWEVVADGGKIVGLSQVRKRNGVVLSSGVLIAPAPWGILCDVMGTSRGDARLLALRTASCEQLLGKRMKLEPLAGSLLEVLRDALTAAHASPARPAIGLCGAPGAAGRANLG